MPDYGEILQFLAKNPPQQEAERRLHASLLELMAQCLRLDDPVGAQTTESLSDADDLSLEQAIAQSHINWVHYN